MKKSVSPLTVILFRNRLYLMILLVSSLAVSTLFSQNVSGLEGKSLTKVDDIAAGIASFIGSKGVEGKITKVTVTADGERTLKLVVEYSGFPEAYLHPTVLRADKAAQNEVGATGLDLTGKTSPVNIEFQLNDNVAEGFKLESAYLQIRVSRNKTAVGGLIFLFAMNKTWQKEIRAENLMLQARLEPVGFTSQLKEENKVIMLPVKKSLLTQQFSQQSAIKTQPIQTTTTAKTTQMTRATFNTPVYEKAPPKPSAGTTDESKPSPVIAAKAIDNRYIVAGLALNKSETDSGAKGPDNNPLPLFEDLRITRDFEFPYEITNISMDIFPDKNPESGIFYYMPAAYHLRWTPDDGYAFRILYGTASSESAGQVRMTATLSPDISKKEIDLITKLLTSYVSRNPGMKFTKLRMIPISEEPGVSFPAELNSQYEITAEKVSVNIASSLREPFQVGWATDNNTKDEMQVSLLERTGIQGMMSIKPQSEYLPVIKIPVVITLADSRTIGRIDLENKMWRTTPWKNQTPYPLKLKYIHMLLVKDDATKSTPVIYSWSLNDLTVPVSSSVSFDASNVPSWVDDPDMAQRIWIEYSVLDCDDCDRAVINKITGGTFGASTRKVTFETFQLFENLDAQFIQIKVRSRQADPKGEKLVELDPVRIYRDNEMVESGQLYVPLNTELAFEYYITVVMKNGNSYKTTDWLSSGEQEIYLGLDAVKNAIPGLPVKNEE